MDTKNLLRSLSLLLIVASLILLASSAPNGPAVDSAKSKLPTLFDFVKYVEKFKKNYSATEALNKAKLFFARTLKIFKHNILFKSNKVSYFLAQNQFTDLTQDELRNSYLGGSKALDLGMVDEARKFPDRPADSLPSVASFRDTTQETESRSSIFDMSESEPTNPVLNFFEEVPDFNLGQVVRAIEEKSTVMDGISKVVTVGSGSSDPQAEAIEQARKDNLIDVAPVVDPDNKNYDLEVIPSYGLFDATEKFYNQAKFSMDDLIIDAYPEPTPPKRKISVPTPKPEPEPSSMSSILSLVKDIYDFVILPDYFGDDEYDSDDEDKNKDKDKPVAKEAAKKPITYLIDWRVTGCIAEPRNQMSCNACYAFASLSLMEFFHCRQTKKLTEFSPQYIVDCGAKSRLGGCQGGKLGDVKEFIAKYGVELGAFYRYSGKQAQCPYTQDEDSAGKTGYLRPEIPHWHRVTDMAAWYKWLPKSPLLVGINMPADFLGYGGGVHEGAECNPEMTHAMLLVGAGNEDGKDFWLLKNSYSTDWGESGYFRLAKSAPLRCFNSAVVARANFSP